MAELTHKSMIPIPISELIAGIKIPVDIFVRLGDAKFVLLARANTVTQKDQLRTYEGKEVEYLWVKKSEYGRLTRKTIAIAGVVLNNDNLNVGQKSLVLTAAAQSVFKELTHIGLNLDSFSHAKKVTEATVALVENHSTLHSLMESLKQCSEPTLRHSMAVSVVSVMMGQAMKWENKLTLEKLALGGLLHDIGKKVLPPEILNKPLAMMSSKEVELYQTHPFKGMEMLVSIGVVPDDVVSIVYEHHENSIGQGFPQKLRNVKIHPLARVTALANAFINLTIPSPAHPHSKNPREALMVIEHTMGQPYNRETFRALKALVDNVHLKPDVA
ncbi:MAG: HD domain-containing protein [Bdellovibrionales bacterium]|nr:HD domain-containing protein [Bdellovibrionales bacterium]